MSEEKKSVKCVFCGGYFNLDNTNKWKTWCRDDLHACKNCFAVHAKIVDSAKRLNDLAKELSATHNLQIRVKHDIFTTLHIDNDSEIHVQSL